MGFTRSSVDKQAAEFVIHCQKEADLIFKAPLGSEQVDKILSVLQRAYWNRKRINLPFFLVEAKELKDYQTT